MSFVLLCFKHMSFEFWAEALNNSIFIINMLPIVTFDKLSPYECLFKSHQIMIYWVFGSLCYPNLSVVTSHKLQPWSFPCVLLDYSSNHHGYRCYCQLHRVFISRHINFFENIFPYKFLLNSSTLKTPTKVVTSVKSPASTLPSLLSPLPIFSPSSPLPHLLHLLYPNPYYPHHTTNPLSQNFANSS